MYQKIYTRYDIHSRNSMWIHDARGTCLNFHSEQPFSASIMQRAEHINLHLFILSKDFYVFKCKIVNKIYMYIIA